MRCDRIDLYRAASGKIHSCVRVAFTFFLFMSNFLHHLHLFTSLRENYLTFCQSRYLYQAVSYVLVKILSLHENFKHNNGTI